ncbi:MAG: hypothetical protein HKN23_15235 [Verrucomicrobiales bacterium]|nr:hypothetical protein [Verrucomicrobiales bacterium]
MSISIKLDSPSPAPAPKPKKQKRAKSGEEKVKSGRRAVISSVIIGSIVVHLIGLALFGLWTVAEYFNRPEARFEVKKKVVKIPPKPPEHKMNVAKHEAMAPKPVFDDKLVSTRPTDFALPELPQVNLDQMLPLDPSELISDQVNGLVGSAALGSGLGQGLGGGGGTGEGMSFFGVKADGDRIVLLFDVSSSVVNKATKAGVPLERIQEETLKLIEGLPIAAQFSMIQFTQNYKPFTTELLAATPGNKRLAQEWVREEWVTSGTMSGREVVSNSRGLVEVLEKAFAMRPNVIFLISDASFQWRPKGGNKDIPYRELRKVIDDLQDSLPREAPIHFIGFAPDDEDVKEWKRILRRSDGEFRELKEK